MRILAADGRTRAEITNEFFDKLDGWIESGAGGKAAFGGCVTADTYAVSSALDTEQYR